MFHNEKKGTVLATSGKNFSKNPAKLAKNLGNQVLTHLMFGLQCNWIRFPRKFYVNPSGTETKIFKDN